MTHLPLSDTLREKENKLREILGSYGALVIAYSGGVDSTYLADIACETLGDRAHLAIADSPSIPRSELTTAVQFARDKGWTIQVIPTHEFDDDRYLQNDTLRCYYCKTGLFGELKAYARDKGIPYIAHGELADDALDTTRVGIRAAVEQGAVAPLAEAGLHKEEVRRLSKERGLPTWDKPSFACLSSRFPKNTPITPAAMGQIETAEEFLKELDFRQYRVRHHDTLCRIEIEPTDFERLLRPEIREQILTRMQALGYRHITLDLAGYRTGSTAR